MAKEGIAKVSRLTRWQRIGIAMLLLGTGLAVAGVVFVFSGVYNIGAGREHWSITNFAITILRDRSIAVAASDIPVPELDDPDLYLLGEQHFRRGCATCHGMPGERTSPIYANMLPSPPDLAYALEDYGAAEVYWIIYHGLKFTGMPAWSGPDRGDEVWPLVAYLARAGRLPPEELSARAAARADAPTRCDDCHDSDAGPGVSDLVPRLAGLPEAYLRRAMMEYRNGMRDSGIMAPVAYDLSDTEIAEFASYYADLTALDFSDDGEIETNTLGETIALRGLPQSNVPACASCHGGDAAKAPPLAGQSRRYMNNQLGLWRTQPHRFGSPAGRLMGEIGERLTTDEADAVSAYYAAQPAAEASR